MNDDFRIDAKEDTENTTPEKDFPVAEPVQSDREIKENTRPDQPEEFNPDPETEPTEILGVNNRATESISADQPEEKTDESSPETEPTETDASKESRDVSGATAAETDAESNAEHTTEGADGIPESGEHSDESEAAYADQPESGDEILLQDADVTEQDAAEAEANVDEMEPAADATETELPEPDIQERPYREYMYREPFMPTIINGVKNLGGEIASRFQYNFKGIILPFLVIVGLSILLYMPYLSQFSRKDMGIGFVHKYRQTTNLDGFITMFGLFLFIFITILTRWWYVIQLRQGRRKTGVIGFAVAVTAILAIAYYVALTFFQIDYSVLILCLLIILLILSIYRQGTLTDAQKFALLMAFMAVSITGGCEIIFIKDFYQGGSHRRFNTIFKFYMQAWFFFAAASAFLLAHRFRIRRPPGLKKLRLLASTSRWLWNVLFILLLSGSLIFTFLGPPSRRYHGSYGRVLLPLTLDGHGYMKKGPLNNEYRSINWLNENVEGNKIILTASGADYLYQYGRISANTGLSCVLGWWSHVDQRDYDRNTGRMKQDIKEMFNSLNIPHVLKLLRQYAVDYIYIGKTEKSEYSEAGLDKFKELTDYMTPVYANPDVTIYKINDYGLNVDFATVAAGSNALAELQNRVVEEKRKIELKKQEEAQRRREALRKMKPRSMFVGGIGEARGQFNEPRSLGVDPDGNVFVADFRNHRIQEFNADGEWLKAWGTSGDKQGQFQDICDVAADAQFVYVVDTFNNRIQKFDKKGTFIGQFRDMRGTTLFYPRGIAVDKTFVYVADTGNNRIVKLNKEGGLIKIWGKLGNQPGELDGPIGICVHQGKLYVNDTRNQRIQVFDTDGNFLNGFNFDGWEGEVFVEPYITMNSTGKLWVSDPTGQRVVVLDQTGKKITEHKFDYKNRTFNHPMGLALAGNGDILVVDTHNHRITKILNQTGK